MTQTVKQLCTYFVILRQGYLTDLVPGTINEYVPKISFADICGCGSYWTFCKRISSKDM